MSYFSLQSASSRAATRRNTSARPRGLTLIELLCSLGIMIILLALILSAIMRAKEMARRTTCQNHLRQLGLAVLQYEQIHGVLPPGRDATAKRDHSWITAVLPQLEQTRLAEKYDYNYRWNDNSPGVDNFQISQTTLPLLICPSTQHAGSGLTDYGGNYGSSLSGGLSKGFGLGKAWDAGVLLAIHTPSLAEPRTDLISLGQITDGITQTFLVLEDAGRPTEHGGQWASGQQCLAHEYSTINASRRQGIFSDHPGGAHAMMVDASVRFLTDSVDPRVIGAMATRAQGDTTDGKD